MAILPEERVQVSRHRKPPTWVHYAELLHNHTVVFNFCAWDSDSSVSSTMFTGSYFKEPP